MFYSHQILARKGPLGTIWIAAHLDRKLRKAQVYETDIEQSVDTIMYPKVPIALRLSANLLLGVVRIYNRKVNYLFQDCSEALVKMKQAFKAAPSAAVDLPPESAAATYAAVTLPEHNYDVQLDLLLEDAAPQPLAYDCNLDAHVTTRASITLLEAPAAYGSQIDYEDRFALPGETTLPPMEDEALLQPMEDEFAVTGQPMEVVRDEKGVRISGARDDDNLPQAYKDTPETFHDAATSTPLPSVSKSALKDNSFDFMAGAPPLDDTPPRPSQTPQHEQRGEDAGGLPLNATANTEDPPMSEAKVKQARNRRAPKRRRIQVDETIEIPPAQIRAALDDTSDILRPKRVADLNTISSQMKGYRRFAAKGGMEKGFLEPSVQGVPPALYVLYARVMVPGGARLQGLDGVPAADPAEAPEETPAKPPAENGTTPVTPDSTAVKDRITPMTTDEDIRPSFGGEPLDFTAQQLDFPTQDVEHAAAPAGAAEEMQVELQPQDAIDNMHIDEERPRASTGAVLERHSLVDDEAEDDDESGHADKFGWSVRTRNVASFLKKSFKELDRASKSPANKKAASHSTLGLDAMVTGKSRREAARMFFEMLVLKTKDYVHLEQEEPYSDITILARPRLLSARV